MANRGNISSVGAFSELVRISALVVFLGFVATTARSASISYGNFGPVPPGISFLNVTESSGTDAVPLFGPPTPFSIGLDFDPMNFTSVGSSGSNDITDGQLNFGVQTTSPTIGIGAISLFESGDFTLAGTGTAATQVFAGVIMRITVTQIDGMNVSPISLGPVNASVVFNLAANPGVVQPWSLSITADVNSQLTALGVTFDAGATKLDVVINNQLGALSETNSLAFIAKKDFQVNIRPDVIPEPSSAMLFVGALGGLLLFRRVRR